MTDAKKFTFTAEVTISIYTEVTAKTLEEAMEIAEYRDLMPVFSSGIETAEEHWMCEELDGTPENICQV